MPETTPPVRRTVPWKIGLVIAVIAGLLVANHYFPLKQYAISLLESIRDLGPWGYAIFVAVYILAAVLFVPGSVLTLGAGAVFGLARGFLAVSAGSTLGASAAFLVGRFLARDAIARKVAGNPRFEAIDEAVGRQGFKIVFLTRLSPVFPFNLLNYAYGLTRVRFWPFVLASWIGMMPGTLLYVYLGMAAGDLAKAASGAGATTSAGYEQTVLKVVGLLATIVVTLYITRLARKALRVSALQPTATPPRS